ncbi:ATP-binding cassette domain-containing protein [Herbaspirillum sp. RTI4]|uniref:methionine ABC transporter ATP-binding protein n=1 Tax=Herbaspirillum sp. RTI4 TaxID=3048640 RepID=UPI002AB41456|nr:ATP-binding cassette domain-containing protein [Herbaspirillum sp. RTI4]MDY7578465.1 ATP-binding cassette domain-containing protein [Herbaspirillum sp. RTI4]MEA9981506.1 ATP-binding cassette domain-containing protein [Herbaspirillum sp. RTI4]
MTLLTTPPGTHIHAAPPIEKNLAAPEKKTQTEVADIVRFERVGYRYPAPASAAKTATADALTDIDFSIAKGEVFGIIGRSGAGKSTLVRTINLLEAPTSGRVLINGIDLSTLSERQLAQARRRIGMIFQHFNLLSSKTVADNIGLPLRIAGVPAREIKLRVEALLELVGLSDKHDAYPAHLSGGQKQRVGIARALVHEPDILLCDEATSALDPESTQSILALLREINQRLKLTIVLITHEMAVIREVCDRVAVLDKGRVVELDQIWRVFGAPQAEATRALLRPLAHDLPADLRHRISDSRQAPQDQLLLDIRIDGASQLDPDLTRLVGSLGSRAIRLVHGGIERIQGRAQGRLIVSVEPGVHADGAHSGAWAELLGLAPHSVRALGFLEKESIHA